MILAKSNSKIIDQITSDCLVLNQNF